MKLWKILGVLAVITAVGASSFAAAAKLNINAGGLQAGNAVITGCQGDVPVGVAYGTHYDASISTTLVDTVTVSGLVPACISDAASAGGVHTIKVVLTFGPAAICAPVCFQDLGAKNITASSVVYSIPAGSQPSAVNLTDVHIVIN